MLYLRKAEEARISYALDRQRFSNVVVAEPATVPFTSQSRWLLVMALGVVLGSLASVVLAVVADRWGPSLRTPEEGESLLGSPVVAACPKQGDWILSSSICISSATTRWVCTSTPAT